MTAVVVLRRVALVVMLALIVLRPGFGATGVATTGTREVAIVLVVDRTKSMDALDVDAGPRFDRLRTDLIELVRSLPRARFALISFAARAKVELPLTSDLVTVEQTLAELDLEKPVDAAGSRLDRPIRAVRKLAQQTVRRTPDALTGIVVASDGETTVSGDQASYSSVAGLFSAGVVLGYGTERGGPMTLAGGRDVSEGFILDRGTNLRAISRLDPKNLSAVAEELRVPYVHRDQATGIDSVAARFGEATVEGTTVASRKFTWLFAMVLLLLALIELRGSWRGLLSTARDRGRSR